MSFLCSVIYVIYIFCGASSGSNPGPYACKNALLKNRSRAGDVAQWHGTCLACTRPWGGKVGWKEGKAHEKKNKKGSEERKEGEKKESIGSTQEAFGTKNVNSGDRRPLIAYSSAKNSIKKVA